MAVEESFLLKLLVKFKLIYWNGAPPREWKPEWNSLRNSGKRHKCKLCTRKIPPGQFPPQWITPNQIPPNLTLTQPISSSRVNNWHGKSDICKTLLKKNAKPLPFPLRLITLRLICASLIYSNANHFKINLRKPDLLKRC